MVGTQQSEFAAPHTIYSAFPTPKSELENTMLKNYLKTALRNLRKYKGYSFIDITRLAIGMMCSMIIGTLVVSRQMDFIRNKKLGLDKENLAYIWLSGEFDEKRVGKLSGYFAAIAIFIASLGLYGLASYVAEQCTKAIRAALANPVESLRYE